MICSAVSWFTAGPIVTLKGIITGEKNREILVDQVHPMTLTLHFASDVIIQDDSAPIYAPEHVQLWFDEHENEVKNLHWPAKSLHYK
ncbi:DDE_3 domain-containing protein [Trichonephila clavipes]|nr:DDE_3 domain-containing protein [Trichonephila clavipes]